MAGAIGGGSGSGGNNFGGREKNAEASTKQIFALAQNNNDYSQKTAIIAEREEQFKEETDHLTSSNNSNNVSNKRSISNLFSNIPKSTYPLIIIGLIFSVTLVVLFTWLSSRFKFVWFNSIHNDSIDIVEPYCRYKIEGNSLFKVMLMISVIGLLAFALIAGGTIFSINSAGGFDQGFNWTFLAGLKMLLAPILIFLSIMIIFAILTVCIDHFVVTIMAMDRCLFGEAWNKFTKIYKDNTKDFWLYILLLIGLGIATGIIATIIAVIAVIALMIVAAIVFGLLFVIFQMIMKAKIIFTIVAFALGIPFALAAFILLSSIGLPFAVFFRNFSLYYISNLDCPYNPLALDNFEDTKSMNI